MIKTLVAGTIALFLGGAPALAAPPAALEGDWSGALQTPRGDLRLVLHVRSGAGGVAVVVDSPDQGVTGLAADHARYENGSLVFEIPSVHGRYEGHWDDARQILAGIWTQNGATLALDLGRGTSKAPDRPQTPKAPFPYGTEDVTFTNGAATGVVLAGTLTLPKASAPYPAIVLVAGSGPNDRDETIAGHKPFAVIADALTRRGLAVLRFDKRGVGKSSGNYGAATTADFASDAAAAAAYLRSRRDIAPDGIGLLGHSEGGLIGPLVADADSKLAYLILLAGPGVRGDQILVAQNRAIGQAAGLTAAQLDAAASVNRSLYDLVAAERDDAKLKAALEGKLAAAGIPESARPSEIAELTSTWLRSFITYDPGPALSKLRLPVLALIGSKDLQVPPAQNIPVLRAALAGNPLAQVETIDGVNHLFQTTETGLPEDYARIAETISPAVLAKIGDFAVAYGRR